LKLLKKLINNKLHLFYLQMMEITFYQMEEIIAFH